jgi:isopenicillin-N epimerase
MASIGVGLQDGYVGPPPELAEYFLLRKDVTFLNHGSFGACPRPVLEVFHTWQRELEAQPVAFLGRRVKPLLAEARAILAAYVGTTADNLVFVPNTTFGVNIVARSLQLQPGDEVLSSNHEYGAVDRIWRFNCGRTGARYINQPIPLPVENVDAVADLFWAGVTERTRVIVLSHISSFSALIFPVAEICRRARAAGILTVIDGAHAPGQIDLQLDELGADFYIGNCHKWLCAPKGVGFFYARPEQQELLEPFVVGWGWQSANPGPSTFIDHFDWLGTDDPSAYLTVPAALAFQQEHDWPTVRDACHALAGQARARIGALTGLPQICPDSQAWWNQMCSIPLPPIDVAALHNHLLNDYNIEIPVIGWQDRVFIRVSIQAYNNQGDVDTLLDALENFLGDTA